MDMFLKEKSDFLSKKDKSKKGGIDKDIIPLISLINSSPDYYTTSSCAGRIVLISTGRRKNECQWILAKHSKVSLKEVISSLKESKSQNPIWLKQQPIILHVACRNIESANSFLLQGRRVFKKCGIISMTKHKVVVEVIGSDNIDAIVKDGNFTAPESYLKHLLKYSNSNFMQNKRKTDVLLKSLKAYLG